MIESYINYPFEKTNNGAEPDGREGLKERGTPATLAAAMTDNGGLSAANNSLMSIVFSLYPETEISH